MEGRRHTGRIQMSESEDSFIEKRKDERVVAKIAVRFFRLTEAEEREAMQSGNYRDIFSSGNLHEQAPDDDHVMEAFTQNISISGLKLVGDLRMDGVDPMKEGMALKVELQIPDAPQAISALARVVWTAPSGEGKSTAGLFFEAINKSDVDKVSRFLVLQKRAQMGGK